MKRNKINYILLVPLLVIWGLVFNKFFNFLNPSNQELKDKELFDNHFSLLRKKKSFELNNVNRDPFLGKIKKKRKIVNIKSANKKDKQAIKNSKKKRLVKKKIPFKLNYFGFIKGGNNTQKISLLKVNNKMVRLQEGEVYEKVKVLKVFKDSLKIKLEDKVLYLKKETNIK